MHCPFCLASDTKVIDSRLVDDGLKVRRRRECLNCCERFTSYESAELILPAVIKKDGQRCRFDEQKIYRGMQRSLEKRPVSTEEVLSSVQRVVNKARAYGEREIHVGLIGDWVMEELKKTDQVAYVRFASVYRSFQDVNEFSEELKRLKDTKNEKGGIHVE